MSAWMPQKRITGSTLCGLQLSSHWHGIRCNHNAEVMTVAGYCGCQAIYHSVLAI